MAYLQPNLLSRTSQMLYPTQEQTVGLVPVYTASTDYSIYISDCGNLTILVIKVIRVSANNYIIYN